MFPTSRGRTRGSDKIQKTNHACIVEAHESTRKRLESTLPKRYEDHFAEKGFHSKSHNNLVMQTCSYVTSEEHSGCERSAVDKEREKLEKLPAWNLDKVHSTKELILEAQREKKEVANVETGEGKQQERTHCGEAQREKNKLPA